MIPIGGITAITSLLIIITKSLVGCILWLFDKSFDRNMSYRFMKNPNGFIAFTTFCFFTSIILLSVLSLFYLGTKNGNNNFIVIHEIMAFDCVPLNTNTHEKMVVLRLDDVQAYGWTDISIAMMNDALSYNFPVTAGVIPKGLHEDKRVIKFINKNYCAIEYALHGYDNEYNEEDINPDGEFFDIDAKTATAKLTAGRDILSKYSNQVINVFIPPHNQLSKESEKALAQEGFSIVSSGDQDYFDYHTATFNFETNKFVYSEKVITDCEKRFLSGHDLCVIMLHPQDFANSDQSLNTEFYGEYKKILDWLLEKKYSVLTMNEVAERKIKSANFSENLNAGVLHDDVMTIQKILNKLGYIVATYGQGSPGNEARYFGPQTQRAIVDFQKHEGLEITDSGIDSATIKRLLLRSLDLDLDF